MADAGNDSAAESLTIDQLIDDQFGDITQVAGLFSHTTCVTGIDH